MKLRTIDDVTNMIGEELTLLRRGKIKPTRSNAVMQGVGKIFAGVKLRMDYAKQTGQTPNIAMLDVSPRTTQRKLLAAKSKRRGK